jgi:hypothetical protein
MKEIVGRVWREPAVFIGLATSVALLIIKFATGDPWDAATIAGVAAPFVSSLGIRELVSPVAAAPDEQPSSSATP